jgi:hypothetical protein
MIGDLKLSPMRLLFVRHLVGTGDALRAVIAAGYSTRGRSPQIMGWRLLRDPAVRAAIQIVALALGLPEPDLGEISLTAPAAPQWGAEHRAKTAAIVAGAAEIARQRHADAAGRRAGVARAREARWHKRALAGKPVPWSYWTAE